LGFIKRVLRVKQPGNTHVALPERHYWFRSVVRFWSAIVKACFDLGEGQAGCEVLHDIVQADIGLAPERGACWTQEVCGTVRRWEVWLGVVPWSLL